MKYWILLFILPALSMPAAAQAYKCRSADGRMEITNTPCPSGANTVKTVREEPVSEASRQRAEQEAARMRESLDKLEATQRREEAAERERQASERQASQRQPVVSSESNGRSVEDCLRDLDRQALQPAQRAQMEAACRGAPQPVYVPVPVVVQNHGGNPVDNCIAEVQRLNLMPAERQRRINQCQGSYSPPARPVREQEHHAPPGLAKPLPLGAPPPPCPPGSKNCPRR